MDLVAESWKSLSIFRRALLWVRHAGTLEDPEGLAKLLGNTLVMFNR